MGERQTNRHECLPKFRKGARGAVEAAPRGKRHHSRSVQRGNANPRHQMLRTMSLSRRSIARSAFRGQTPMPDLSVALGRLELRNPILVASGTFGYAREMAGIVDFSRLGAIIPKTVTRQPRAGNKPPRTVETPSGMLNAIGLDNDGIEHFISHHLPYLRTLPTAVIANIAGKTEDEFIDMAALIGREKGLAALELNLSCPNVSGGIDFATDPAVTRRVVARVREVCPLPVLAKLTPNVTDLPAIAAAAAEAG